MSSFVIRTSLVVTSLCVLAAPGRAQSVAAGSPAPISAISAEWLRVDGGAMDRDGSPSSAFSVAHDFRSGVRIEVGYLRAARTANTAKGATAAISIPASYGRLTVRPALAVLGGTAQASHDTGGYYYLTPTGQAGYQPRMAYTRGTTWGAIASIGAELRIAAGISAIASLREARFSGRVLEDDRNRTLGGLGLAVRPDDLLQALHFRRASTDATATPTTGTSK